MKTTLKLVTASALLFTFLFITSCSNTPKGDEAKVADEQGVDSAGGQSLTVDTIHSKVSFIGYGVGKNHPGYFSLLSGTARMADGKLTGGSFVININSLVLDQKEEMFQTKLLGHLLSPDFFEASKYPAAKFEVTSLESYMPNEKDTSVVAGANYKVSGNLTLKDITKNITFPAKIETGENSFSALANFTIDRTLWGIKYGNDKSLKDKFISEVVTISLDIKSK